MNFVENFFLRYGSNVLNIKIKKEKVINVLPLIQFFFNENIHCIAWLKPATAFIIIFEIYIGFNDLDKLKSPSAELLWYPIKYVLNPSIQAQFLLNIIFYNLLKWGSSDLMISFRRCLLKYIRKRLTQNDITE